MSSAKQQRWLLSDFRAALSRVIIGQEAAKRSLKQKVAEMDARLKKKNRADLELWLRLKRDELNALRR